MIWDRFTFTRLRFRTLLVVAMAVLLGLLSLPANTHTTFAQAAGRTMQKDNDANQDGGFSDTETVPGNAVYPVTVTYRLTFKNDNDLPRSIDAISDDKVASPLVSAVYAPSCDSVIGTNVPENGTLTCYYDKTFANADLGTETNTATAVVFSDPLIDTSTVHFAPSPPPNGQGCTPGFWKQPHHFDDWVGYSPGDSYDAVFGVSSSFGNTLLAALNRGGGGESALGRHATAALLNAASPDVSYHYTAAEIIALVQAAYVSGDFEGAKDLLAYQNERGCPL